MSKKYMSHKDKKCLSRYVEEEEDNYKNIKSDKKTNCPICGCRKVFVEVTEFEGFLECDKCGSNN